MSTPPVKPPQQHSTREDQRPRREVELASVRDCYDDPIVGVARRRPLLVPPRSHYSYPSPPSDEPHPLAEWCGRSRSGAGRPSWRRTARPGPPREAPRPVRGSQPRGSVGPVTSAFPARLQRLNECGNSGAAETCRGERTQQPDRVRRARRSDRRLPLGGCRSR